MVIFNSLLEPVKFAQDQCFLIFSRFFSLVMFLVFPNFIILNISIIRIIASWEFSSISCVEFLTQKHRKITKNISRPEVFYKKGVLNYSALYGLRQFLITENPLKMMKNAFYFTLKALFILKIFKFLSWLFRHVEKTARLER